MGKLGWMTGVTTLAVVLSGLATGVTVWEVARNAPPSEIVTDLAARALDLRAEATRVEALITVSQRGDGQTGAALEGLARHVRGFVAGPFGKIGTAEARELAAAISEQTAEAQASVTRPNGIKAAGVAIDALSAQLGKVAAVGHERDASAVAEAVAAASPARFMTQLAAAIGALLMSAVAAVAVAVSGARASGADDREAKRLEEELRRTRSEAESAKVEADLAMRGAEDAADELRRRNAEIALREGRFDATLSNMTEGVCMVEPGRRVAVVNERFAAMFGLPFEPIAGTAYSDVVGLGDGDVASLDGLEAEAGHPEGSSEYALPGDRWIKVNRRAMPDGGWVATYEDVSERRQADDRMTYLANHDSLTGLKNRRFIADELEPAVARAERMGNAVALVTIDLDGFKEVNDSYGHDAGDELLIKTAERLRAASRAGDIIARMGGDEFAILMANVEGDLGCEALARRVLTSLEVPMRVKDVDIAMTASIGIAVARRAREVEGFAKRSDVALYEAKSAGRNQWRFFEPAMDQARRERRSLDVDMRAGFAAGEFTLHYQPLVDARTRRTLGYEALMRWKSATRGYVSPGTFIPLAEETGMIAELGAWAIRQACVDCAAWPDDLGVAVNVSPLQLKDERLVLAVREGLALTGLDARRLEIEITESALMDETPIVMRTLNELRAVGVRFALDDFGTGYSSLSYLQSFSFKKLKIDQSFVRQMTTDKASRCIVEAIIQLGRGLGMETLAEGVETEEELGMLLEAGCEQAQGWLFGRPQPVAGLPAQTAIAA